MILPGSRVRAPRRRPGRLLLAACLVAAAGCGGGDGSATEDGELPIEDVEPAPDVAASLETDPQGRRSAGPEVAGVLPGGFPGDVPLYRPSSLVDFGATDRGAFVLFFTPDAAAGVRASLEAGLARSGWSRQGDGWAKGGRTLRLEVAAAGPGAEIRIEY